MIWHSYVDEQKPLKTLSFFSAGVTLGLFLKITIFNEEGILNKFIRESFGKKDEKNVSLGELKEEHSGKKKQWLFITEALHVLHFNFVQYKRIREPVQRQAELFFVLYFLFLN